MKPLAFVWMGLLGVSLIGCNSLQSPTVSVRGVTVQEVTPQGVRALVELELQNPNKEPLPLVRSDYRVSLSGLGEQAYSERLQSTIPAEGRQTITLPAAWAWDGQAPVADQRNFLAAGSVSYQTPGEIRKLLTESKVALPSVAFSQQGAVELSSGASWGMSSASGEPSGQQDQRQAQPRVEGSD